MENTPPPRKQCSKCKAFKLFTAFREEPRVKNKMSAACKECLSNAAKNWYHNSKALSSKL